MVEGFDDVICEPTTGSSINCTLSTFTPAKVAAKMLYSSYYVSNLISL